MSTCKKCGAEVVWVRKHGRLTTCQNPDGSDHWDLCSKRIFDDVKKQGKHFIEHNGLEIVHGYRSKKYGEKAYLREGTFTIGKGYKPVMHKEDCNVLPWDECQCR